MKANLVIRGGTIIDPAQNVNFIGNVYVAGEHIAGIEEEENESSLMTGEIIDASGCLVVPGLIDFHTHLFYQGSELGILPDAGLLPLGVTTAVDAGSAGAANYELFSKSIIARSTVRIKAFLNVCSAGLATTKYHENVDPRYYDEQKITKLLRAYSGEILGIKLRQSREIVGNLGLEPLKAALDIADRLGCPIAVHTTNPPGNVGELVRLLRRGDIYVHVYQGTGANIIESNGKVAGAVREARDRGVIFDAANGRNHFVFEIAQAALADDFLPDIISTDITLNTMYRRPVFGLPYILSKYLALGVPFMQVLAACTSVPAALMKLDGEIGTLAPGACADIAIFRIKNHAMAKFSDTKGKVILGDQLLVPCLTMRAGRVVYRSVEF